MSKILTLAYCLKIKLKNGKKLGFTTNSSSIRFFEEPDLIYSPKGFTPSSSSSNSDVSVDNLESQMIIDNDMIKVEDLERELFNNAYFEFFIVDWTKKTNGYFTSESIYHRIMNGVLGEIKRDKKEFNVEFRSLIQYFSNNIVDLYKPSCSAEFGDSRCKLNIITENLYIDTTITNIYNQRKEFYIDINSNDGIFNNGIIEFLSGENEGMKYKIKSWKLSDKKLILQLPSIYNVNVGDEVRLVFGCNKTLSKCEEFNNIINYRGFPYIPGSDFLLSGGDSSVISDD